MKQLCPLQTCDKVIHNCPRSSSQMPELMYIFGTKGLKYANNAAHQNDTLGTGTQIH
jgi:hypothetical protein